MSDKRRALGRGLGALIPQGSTTTLNRPVDVFFADRTEVAEEATRTSHEGPDEPLTSENADSGAPAQVDGASHDEAIGEVPETAAKDQPGDGADVSRSSADGRPELADESSLRPVPGAEFAEVALDDITPNPRQPRTVFDEDDKAELVASIREIGVLQPVVVRRNPSTEEGAPAFELIMGERRWRASRAAGNETVPAIIKGTADEDLLRDALLENLHRAQLNPLEEAAAYQQLLDDFGCSHEELATRIGRSRPQISNTLRLLKLPPLVARRVAAGVLSAGHARALLSLPDGAAMERLAQRVVAEGLSVRSVEEIVALGDDETPAARRRPRSGARHPQMDDLAASLSDRLDTRVKIALGQRKGRITVEFASVADLRRILGEMSLDQTGIDLE
jgi:ParB family chromosome partitioning protein